MRKKTDLHLHNYNIDKLTNNDAHFQLENEQILNITTPSLNAVATDRQVIKPVIKWDKLNL